MVALALAACLCGGVLRAAAINQTPVTVPGSAKNIADIVVGDTILVVSRYAYTGGVLRLTWSKAPTTFSSGTNGGQAMMVYIVTDSTRTVVLSPDQLLMRSDGTLTAASKVKLGDSLALATGAADGVTTSAVGSVTSAATGLYEGGVHHFSVGGSPQIAGHLFGLGGLVAGDYALQVHSSQLQ